MANNRWFGDFKLPHGTFLEIVSMKRIAFALLVLFGAISMAPQAGATYSHSAIPSIFAALAHSKAMANPSIIVIDPSTGEVVYQYEEKSLRKPASVMKVLSATAALSYIEPTRTFKTVVSLSTKPRTVVISGSLDPWLSISKIVAAKDHRVWIGSLVSKAITAVQKKNKSKVNKIAIKYNGLYSADVVNIRNAFRAQGIITGAKYVTPSQATELTSSEIASAKSPMLSDMVKFALLWSDNLLAERLARLAAKSAGYTLDDAGVSLTFHSMLSNLGIENSEIRIQDGSGLSKENRITAEMMAKLLVILRTDPKFASIYEGFPVSGVSGTLEDRYLKTAPQAVGLIHAKTGTLNGTVSLAGYVESGDREYVFVVIADHIPKSTSATDLARSALDKTVGKIATPTVQPVMVQTPDELVQPSN